MSAVFGNDVSTFPISRRNSAPVGTLAGVSGFQLHFSSRDIFTPGDQVDDLVVMNPAAFKTNIADLKKGGILLVNDDEFDTSISTRPAIRRTRSTRATGGEVRSAPCPDERLTRDAVEGLGLSTKEAGRCKNFFSLGLVYWLFDRDASPTLNWIKDKFKKKSDKAADLGEANRRAMQGGLSYGEATESFVTIFRVPRTNSHRANTAKSPATKRPPGAW